MIQYVVEDPLDEMLERNVLFKHEFAIDQGQIKVNLAKKPSIDPKIIEAWACDAREARQLELKAIVFDQLYDHCTIQKEIFRSKSKQYLARSRAPNKVPVTDFLEEDLTPLKPKIDKKL